jgi:LPS-assembly protein
LFLAFLLSTNLGAQDRPRVEVTHRGLTLVIQADTIETDTDQRLSALGNVVATYADVRLTTDKLVYQPESNELLLETEFEVTRASGWLRGSHAQINIQDDTGIIYNASGYTDDELYVNVARLIKTGPRAYIAQEGYLTSCEDMVPKWSFRISEARINVETTARLSHTLFRVKKVPLFYFPYLIFPTGHKERSSGFLLPTIGNSNNKGRRISERFYLVLGRSADLLVQGDYYSLRGVGGAATFRTRPNERSSLELSSEFVDDRLGRGGASLYGVGYTSFANGFRAVADFNLVSNFRFRQTFSDNFFTATRPTETSRLFLTNNFRSGSFNLLFGREETTFPSRNIVTQLTPNINFKLIGKRIPGTPFYLDLDSSLGGLNRSDALIETPKISQRLDLYPRLYFSVPLFQGLRLTPTLGFRETFYSDSIETVDGISHVTGRSLRREYVDLGIDLRGWGLSKIYGSEKGFRWKHLIEPTLSYRYIGGIDNFGEIIRFDEVEAIADTNEVAYGISNRVFVKDSGKQGVREWLSVRIAQKYFFDSSFGGALQDGSVNQFFPLNALTGLPYATTLRDYSPVTTEVRFNPSRRSSIDLRGDFDPRSNQFSSFSVTGYYRRNLLSLATTYFVTENLLGSFGRSNQLQGRVGLGDFDRGFSTFASFSYDAHASRLLNHQVRASYFWDCCGISAEVRGFNLGSRNEQQVRFSFFLKGIGSFGNLRRPDNVF